MKKFLLFIFLFQSIHFLIAQSAQLSWAKSMDGAIPGDDITVDEAGNIYTIGNFRETVDFDPGPGIYELTSAGLYDIFITKLNNSGDLVWAQRMGGAKDDMGFSISLDAFGNIFTTGHYEGTSDLDPNSEILNFTSTGWRDIFISKLDPSGNLVWVKCMGNSGPDEAYSLTLDLLGNVYVAGIFTNTVDFDPNEEINNLISAGEGDIFCVKLDNSGNFVWAKSIGGEENEYSYSIKVDNAQNVYLSGFYRATCDFDPNLGVFNLTPSSDDNDIFITKLSSTGDLVWVKSMGGTNVDIAQSLVLDNSGNIYAIGQFTGSTNFSPNEGNLILTSVGDADVFITKLDNSGHLIWVKSFAGIDYCNGLSITVDQLGDIYSTGFYRSSMDCDPNTGTLNLTSTGANDIFISKLNNTGDLIWAKSIGGNGYDFGGSIYVNSSGSIYITGGFQATADFDPNIGTYNLTSTRGAAAFILKMDPCISPPSPTSSDIAICSGNTASLSATGSGTLKWYDQSIDGTLLGTDSTYTTSSLTTTSKFYVEDNTACGISDRTEVIVTVNACTGLFENASSTLANLYPNPTTAQFKINTTEVADQIIVSNILGETVTQIQPVSESTIIDIAPFENGVYFVRVIAKEKSQTIKITKQ